MDIFFQNLPEFAKCWPTLVCGFKAIPSRMFDFKCDVGQTLRPPAVFVHVLGRLDPRDSYKM